MKFSSHVKETGKLAWPLIISQLGHILTGIVDTLFLGHIGKTEQAAGALANQIFVLLLVFGIGISYATTPLVSNADVNKDSEAKASWLKNALVLNGGLSILLFLILFYASPVLNLLHQPADVVELTIPFFNVLIFSIIPVSLFFVGKQFAEGLGNTYYAMWISILGNVLNVILNYVMIHGYCGFSPMGYMGSCWATFIARCVMGFAMIGVLFYVKDLNDFAVFFKKVQIQWLQIKKLLRIGIASGLQFLFEVAAFSLAGIMTGWFGKEQIDAHAIALSIAAATYMIGSGISGAASIRVAHYNAASNWKELKKAGDVALFLVFCFMLFTALLFIVLHNILPGFFTEDQKIIELGGDLLLIAAAFQLFDGIQVVSLGILRGLEDVKIPTLITLITYWGIALPLSYVMGEYWHWEVKGIWYALSISLFLAAFGLYARYRFITHKALKGG